MHRPAMEWRGGWLAASPFERLKFISFFLRLLLHQRYALWFFRGIMKTITRTSGEGGSKVSGLVIWKCLDHDLHKIHPYTWAWAQIILWPGAWGGKRVSTYYRVFCFKKSISELYFIVLLFIVRYCCHSFRPSIPPLWG